MSRASIDHSISHWARVSTILMVTALALLGCRLVYIDTTTGDKLLKHRSRQQTATLPLPARRGLIVDRKGRILAGSTQCPSVFADPTFIDSPAQVARRLAPVIDVDEDDILRRIKDADERGRQFVWLARRIRPEQEQAIRDYHRHGKLDGIALLDEPRRFYPQGPKLAQVVGFVSRDDRGLEGLERFYDETLRGQDGERDVLCSRSRRAIWSATEEIEEPQSGYHIILTIDLWIQEKLEQRLAEAIEEFEADSAVGIVMDPRNGAVLAMASQPTFDPNHFTTDDKDAFRNRCLTDPVEPGSVFKPFIVSAALSENLTTPHEEIDCGPGYHYFGARRIRDTHANGVLSVEDILVKSSNIGMGKIAERLGNARIHRYIRDFGYGEETRIDLPGESRGIVKKLSDWGGYSKQSVAIGQELAVTPIQLASGFCALVNGGTLYRPRIVSRILAADAVTEFEQAPVAIRQVLDPRVARTVAQEMMVRVVAESHHDIHSRHYTILGKTGTAQVAYPDRPGYEPDAYLASFIGAAPAADPRLAVVVMVRKPNVKKGYYGGKVAGPVVRDILDAALAYLEVIPDKPSSRHVAVPQEGRPAYARLTSTTPEP